MHWLQPEENGTYNLQSLQLDIVGFLAILGEGSVLANVQVATLSKWIFLPRLIPAPQAMMRPTRPVDLEPIPGFVSGVWSGNDRDTINHIANIVCDANKLPPFSVRVVQIRRVGKDQPLKAKTFAPLTAVAVIGCGLSAMLLGLSIFWRDGMSIIATVNLSLLSSLIGLGNKWTLQLPKRFRKVKKVHEPHTDNHTVPKEAPEQSLDNKTQTNAKEEKEDYVPPGDVVIRYPKGSFLVIRCNEDVARELYFAPEEIQYLLSHAWAYRLLSLVGTMMLMGGVICLANARIESQIAWAGSYMLLGALYWIVAALPGKLHWDTSPFEVVPEALEDSEMDVKGFPSRSNNFTEALWKAIVVSKDAAWVRRGDHCPGTKAWDDWLFEARNCSREYSKGTEKEHNGKKITIWDIPPWDPVEYFQYLLKEEAKAKESV